MSILSCALIATGIASFYAFHGMKIPNSLKPAKYYLYGFIYCNPGLNP